MEILRQLAQQCATIGNNRRVTLLRLSPQALHATRFALSPLAETLSTVIGAPRSEKARFTRTPFEVGLVRLVSATKYLPDLVSIPPSDMHTQIEDELAAMAAISDAAARQTLADSFAHAWDSPDHSWAEVDRIAERSADFFGRTWQAVVEPDWSRRRSIMERDIRHRAGVLAISGWRHALDGMAKKIEWQGPDAIQFSTQTHADRTVGDDGLVLVPHTGAGGQWTCESAHRLALVYPARGRLSSPDAAPSGVEHLIGRGRSGILFELRHPASPSQLSAALGVSLGTVSGHLAVLRHAGTVVARRSGRAVYYELTETGAALVNLLGTPDGKP